MPKEIILVGGAGLALARAAELIARTPTADIYIGPPPVVASQNEPAIPDLDFRVPKEPKIRDWEQRGKKRRR